MNVSDLVGTVATSLLREALDGGSGGMPATSRFVLNLNAEPNRRHRSRSAQQPRPA